MTLRQQYVDIYKLILPCPAKFLFMVLMEYKKNNFVRKENNERKFFCKFMQFNTVQLQV